MKKLFKPLIISVVATVAFSNIAFADGYIDILNTPLEIVAE